MKTIGSILPGFFGLFQTLISFFFTPLSGLPSVFDLGIAEDVLDLILRFAPFLADLSFASILLGGGLVFFLIYRLFVFITDLFN